MKSMLLAAICLAATPLVAQAQYYPAYPYGPAPPPVSALPPSWSYDPYTSGQAPCPQWHAGDLTSCGQNMPPSYGQPNYHTR